MLHVPGENEFQEISKSQYPSPGPLSDLITDLEGCSGCDHSRLVSKLKHFHVLLETKDEDLRMAVEVGQNLLLQNKELETECHHLRIQFQEKLKAGSEHDEQVHLLDDLQGLVSSLETDLSHRDETIQHLKTKLAQLEKQCDAYASERDDLLQEKACWATDKEALARDIMGLKRTLADKEREFQQTSKADTVSAAKQSSLMKQQAAHISELMNQVESLSKEHRIANQQNQALSTRIQVLEAEGEQSERLQETVMTLEEKCQTLEMELEWERSQRKEVEAKLAVFERPEQGKGRQVQASKSLLGEIEDKRAELQQKHEVLSHTHAGLVKAHTISLHQQQKMKNRLSRLTVLSAQAAQQNHESLLEETLRQKESECRELQARIFALERSRHSDYDTATDMSSDSHCHCRHKSTEDDEHMQSLRHQVQQMIYQIKDLEETCSTLQILKSNEMDKNRSLSAKLMEKEQAYQTLYASHIHLGNEFENLKDRLENQLIVSPNLKESSANQESCVPACAIPRISSPDKSDAISEPVHCSTETLPESTTAAKNAKDYIALSDEQYHQPVPSKEASSPVTNVSVSLPRPKADEKDHTPLSEDTTNDPIPTPLPKPKHITIDRSQVDHECNQQ